MDILLLALLVLVFLGLPFIQMRKQSKQIGAIKTFQSGLRPGMVVQLTSGLHGRITNVGELTVDVEVAPGVVTTWDRGAVLKLVESVDAGSTEADHLTGDAGDAGDAGDTRRAGTDNPYGAPDAEQIPDDLSSLDDAADDADDRTDGDTGNAGDGRR